MRIITGKFRGRTLETIRGLTVRPATERVKGTIFNVLQNRIGLQDAVVLDLFAGSGSLGFEALSRGARQVVFVDDSGRVLDVIDSNAERLGCADDCILIQSDAISFIERTNDRFDLVFADPPYAYKEVVQLPKLILGRGLLKKGGFLIIEHAKQVTFDPDGVMRIAEQKEFGNTRVSFFTSLEGSQEIGQ